MNSECGVGPIDSQRPHRASLVRAHKASYCGPMIRNIWAIGRNYSEHARELGNEVPSIPLVFLKAGSCATPQGSEILLPAGIEELHHEVELALEFDAELRVTRAGLALDLTDRAEQMRAKAKAEPWTAAKSFRGACPLGPFFAVDAWEDLQDLELVLSVDSVERQRGRTSQMIFSFETLANHVIERYPVCEGDLLLTGTPSGVGPLRRGDRVSAEIVGKVRHSWVVR